MTQNGTDVMARADEYARRIEEALADLPQGQRKQLLADLASHLAEITDDGRPVVDQLGPPEEYARELRAAADLMPAGSPGRVSRRPRLVRVAVIASVAVAVAALALVGFVVFRALDTGGNTTAGAVPVPNVVGLPQGVAEQRLSGLGFVTTANPRPCHVPANCDVGKVVTQEPASGARLSPGATVTLTIRQAPDQVTVPDVTGKTTSGALDELSSKALGVRNVTTEDSAKVPAGRVIRTDLKAGTRVVPGSEVTLFIASGLPVPDVTGMQIDAARNELDDLGLQVKSLGRPSDLPEGTVLDEDHIGDVVKINTVIHLTFATRLPTSSPPATSPPASP